MRWGGCNIYRGEEGCVQGSGGRPEGKRQLKDPDIDGRIILRWIFWKWVVKAWTGSM